MHTDWNGESLMVGRARCVDTQALSVNLYESHTVAIPEESTWPTLQSIVYNGILDNAILPTPRPLI